MATLLKRGHKITIISFEATFIDFLILFGHLGAAQQAGKTVKVIESNILGT